LWKAYCFKDQRAADLFSDPEYNLTPQAVVDIFCEDLKKKGIAFSEPEDLQLDANWMKIIVETYAAPAGAAY
jgi:hypothetical protein